MNDDVFSIDEQEIERSKIEKQLELDAFNAAQDLIWLMSDKRGRRFVRSVMDLTGFRGETMTGDNHTFYNLGRAAVGRQLENAILSACPEAYITMITEDEK